MKISRFTVYLLKLTSSICTIRCSDCSIKVYQLINIIFLKILPIMLALCLMLLVTYYAFNYAGIIGLGLTVIEFHLGLPSEIDLEESSLATRFTRH